MHLPYGYTTIEYNTTIAVPASQSPLQHATSPIRLYKNGIYYRLSILSSTPPHSISKKYYVFTFADSPPFNILSVSQHPLTLPCTHVHDVIAVTSLALLEKKKGVVLEGEKGGEEEQERKVVLGYSVNKIEIHSVITTVSTLEKDLVDVTLLDQQCKL